jgi:hypothetical protein
MRRFRTQAAALGDQAHLAVAFVHAALELVGGLHRQFFQAIADAGLDLLGVAALDHADEQEGEDHRQQGEGERQPGAQAARQQNGETGGRTASRHGGKEAPPA